MSSVYVRQQIKSFMATNSDENVIDLTAQYADIKELLSEANLQPDASWIGLQFIGGDEEPVALAATNDQGLYRETGTINIHVVAEAKIGVGDGLLTRGESLRNLFRGRRIGDIVVEKVRPMNTDQGATLDFDDGYMAGTFAIEYHRDLNL